MHSIDRSHGRIAQCLMKDQSKSTSQLGYNIVISTRHTLLYLIIKLRLNYMHLQHYVLEAKKHSQMCFVSKHPDLCMRPCMHVKHP
jgi:hypothetical protein